MQKPDRLKTKGRGLWSGEDGKEKTQNEKETGEQTKGDGKRERENAKKKSILCLRMDKHTLLPSESFLVSLLLILSE